MVFSNDDEVVPVENGVAMYEALRKEKVPVDFHIYNQGGHGFGLAQGVPVVGSWPGLSIAWLKHQGYTPKKR